MAIVPRLLKAILAIWFAFLVAEPIPAHECEMHSPAGLVEARINDFHETSEKDASDIDHKGSEGRQKHSHHGSHSSESQSESQDSHSHHFCLCLGCSAGSQSQVVDQLAPTVPIPADLARENKPYPRVESLALEPDFTHPFATAPPGTLS